MRKTHIVIHHSLTRDSGTVSWGAIRRYHLAKGWTDIGYHIGVELIGIYYEVLMGRAIDADGAHAYQQSMNRKGLGVLFVGNYDAVQPEPLMLQTMAKHLRPLMRLHGIAADADHVVPHHAVAPYKSCPGTQFPLTEFRAMLG